MTREIITAWTVVGALVYSATIVAFGWNGNYAKVERIVFGSGCWRWFVAACGPAAFLGWAMAALMFWLLTRKGGPR